MVFSRADATLWARAKRKLSSCDSNKYTENGEVRISAFKTPNHIDIRIEDTGAGMSEEISSKLFTNATVSTRGSKNEKGNGLGLLLVNEYIHEIDL
ncbi:MAG: ATP-binding protein [Bacteroidetes bacterium]|nr:ATP-binding protein [Bacteroidota bacterium]